MFKLSDISSLTDFKRHTSEWVQRLKSTGRPQVLTVNGRAELVVQDAQAYEMLLELVDRAEAIIAVRQGLDDAQHGDGLPAADVFNELRRKLDVKKLT